MRVAPNRDSQHESRIELKVKGEKRRGGGNKHGSQEEEENETAVSSIAQMPALNDSIISSDLAADQRGSLPGIEIIVRDFRPMFPAETGEFHERPLCNTIPQSTDVFTRLDTRRA